MLRGAKEGTVTVEQISAITLAVRDMAKAVDFYRDKVGLAMQYGGESASFTSFRVGAGYLNLILAPEGGWKWWGRLIFYVDDVDAMYRRLVESGLSTSTVPQDAPWGERYFRINAPDANELSFAKRLLD